MHPYSPTRSVRTPVCLRRTEASAVARATADPPISSLAGAGSPAPITHPARFHQKADANQLRLKPPRWLLLLDFHTPMNSDATRHRRWPAAACSHSGLVEVLADVDGGRLDVVLQLYAVQKLGSHPLQRLLRPWLPTSAGQLTTGTQYSGADHKTRHMRCSWHNTKRRPNTPF